MALRMINGTFEQFDVQQYGNVSAIDDDIEKTTVECWQYQPHDHREAKKIEDELNLPFNNTGEFQDVISGSIVKNPAEIRLNEQIHFYVFRVVVGRAFVMKRSALDEKCNNPRSALHPDYDSIYIQDDQDKSSNDYVSHTYRIFDKEKVKLIYKVTAKIKIPHSVESLTPLCEQCKANLGMGREETTNQFNKHGAEQPRNAELYCINDKTYFCLDHYRDFHQSTILQSHMSIPARDKPLTFGECVKHKKRFEFFNTDLYQALCSQCIITGDMQQTRSGPQGAIEPADKRILRIEDAHTNACAEAVAEDVSLTQKKHVIQQKLQ